MATLEQVTNEIEVSINFLKNGLLREVALDYLTNSKKRIFTDGIKADGSQIGEYSEVTKAIKRKKGRFTSEKVNLRDTETLVNSYVAQPNGVNGYDVGFVSGSSNGVSNTAKIEKLKKQYGDDLLDPSKEELNEIDDLINKLKIF